MVQQAHAEINWTDTITNEEVLRRMDEKERLWKSIVNKKVQLNGHLMRHNGFQKTIIDRHAKGKIFRGRP